MAYGLRNPFRFAIRPGTREVWLGDVGWNTTEEINRIPNPHGRHRRELRLAVLRGLVQAGRLRRGEPQPLREPVRRRCRRGHSPLPHLSRTPARCTPRTRARAADRRSPAWHSRRPGSPLPAEFDGALFFADYARGLHLGHGARRRDGAQPRARQMVPRRAPRRRSTSSSGPAATSSTPTSGRGRSGGSTTPRATRRRVRSRRQPHGGQHSAAPCTFDALGLERPRRRFAHLRVGPRRRRRLRRLEQRAPHVHLHDAAAFTWSGSGSPTAVARPRPRTRCAITAGNTPPAATIAHPDQRLHVGVGDRSTSRAAPRRAGRRLWRRTSSAGRSCSTTAPPTATRTSCRASPATSSGATSPRPDHEYPSYLELTADGHRQRRAHRHADRAARPEDGAALDALGPDRAAAGGERAGADHPFRVTVIQGSANTLVRRHPADARRPRPTTSARGRTAGLRTHSITATAARHLHGAPSTGASSGDARRA